MNEKDGRIAAAGLLVSVRSLREAESIASLGVNVLDWKEPSAGPLAPVAAELWCQVAACYEGKAKLSAALGEFDQALEIAAKLPSSFRFAKAGPSNCCSLDQVAANWATLRHRLAGNVCLVPVAYADHRAAGCPSPLSIFSLAGELGLTTWLLDTFVKDGKTTLDHLTMNELLGLAQLAVAHKASWVLAGSMNLELVEKLFAASVTPDLFGVRGDVCDGGRNNEISPRKVERWFSNLKRTTISLQVGGLMKNETADAAILTRSASEGGTAFPR